MRIRAVAGAILSGMVLAAAGCHVQVDKGSNGEDKNVRIDTPLGGLHVRSDQTTAADLGLPVYPGAEVAPDHEGDKSADVHLGFGEWQLRVKVVTYRTPESQDKVLAFYRNAMGRFGDVLECRGDRAVGTPTTTSKGLTCSEHGHVRVDGSGSSDQEGLSLRAGSRHHQHLLVIRNGDGGTRFSLLELELPQGLAEESSKTSD